MAKKKQQKKAWDPADLTPEELANWIATIEHWAETAHMWTGGGEIASKLSKTVLFFRDQYLTYLGEV